MTGARDVSMARMSQALFLRSLRQEAAVTCFSQLLLWLSRHCFRAQISQVPGAAGPLATSILFMVGPDIRGEVREAGPDIRGEVRENGAWESSPTPPPMACREMEIL